MPICRGPSRGGAADFVGAGQWKGGPSLTSMESFTVTRDVPNRDTDRTKVLANSRAAPYVVDRQPGTCPPNPSCPAY